MSKRLRLPVAAGIGLLVVCLITALWAGREPAYQGRTMGDWLKQRPTPESEQALLILGTNNLPLLIKRVSYDPEKDTFSWFFYQLFRLTRSSRVFRIAHRSTAVAEEAHGIFNRLGPNAAAALPELRRIVEQRRGLPARRAMSILADLGDEGMAVVVAQVSHTNAQTRCDAVELLGHYRGSMLAATAVTNALSDPDARVRQVAWGAITNRIRYTR